MTALRPMLVLLGILVLGCAAAREATAGQVSDQLSTRIDRVVGILQDPVLRVRPPARRVALRDAAIEIFDFTEITRRALGRHWQTATSAERDELVQLLTGLLERAYLGRLEQYTGETVAVLGEAIDGDLATVHTRLVGKSGVETPIDYRLHRAGDRWLVFDVSVEGVSLVANYRAQFNAILRGSSPQALVTRLRARQE
jgi:phospholipid transport system substrate-binding protein